MVPPTAPTFFRLPALSLFSVLLRYVSTALFRTTSFLFFFRHPFLFFSLDLLCPSVSPSKDDMTRLSHFFTHDHRGHLHLCVTSLSPRGDVRFLLSHIHTLPLSLSLSLVTFFLRFPSPSLWISFFVSPSHRPPSVAGFVIATSPVVVRTKPVNVRGLRFFFPLQTFRQF